MSRNHLPAGYSTSRAAEIEAQDYHLSVKHLELAASGRSSLPRPRMAASVRPSCLHPRTADDDDGLDEEQYQNSNSVVGSLGAPRRAPVVAPSCLHPRVLDNGSDEDTVEPGAPNGHRGPLAAHMATFEHSTVDKGRPHPSSVCTGVTITNTTGLFPPSPPDSSLPSSRPSTASTEGGGEGGMREVSSRNSLATTPSRWANGSSSSSSDYDYASSRDRDTLSISETSYPELPDWDPPVPCPEPNGGFGKLRFSALLHYYIMSPLCVLGAASALLYLGWKAVYIYTHITTAGPMAIVFVTLEWLNFLATISLFVEVSRPARDRPALQVPAKGPFPFTNIFICCCKEPVDIIADTVTGAMHQVYPHNRYTVWVLDDGADDNLKAHVEGEAAEKYGKGRLMYLRREKKKGVPHHFKAGNINHGLNHASGEFVAILDADMIPSPYFLTSLLPHFTSEKIAFVQCPQSFYNIAKNDPLNDMSREFYDCFLPYRDGRDTAQCVGTGAIFRMSALRQNGGFTCGTITEDFDTALSLHSQGFDSVYVNQRLQAGLTAWTLEGYVKQHQRWAMGSLELLAKRKPLKIKSDRFNMYRRVAYWWAGACYYMNGMTIVMIFVPLVVLAFDLSIMPPNTPPDVNRLYLILLNPYVLLLRSVSVFLAARQPYSDLILIRAEQPWMWNSYFNVEAVIKYYFPLVSKKFESTGSKKHVEKNVLQRLQIVWFHVIYCVLALGVVAWQLATLNWRQCGRVLKVIGWVPALLFVVQTFAVPIYYTLNAPNNPKPANRKDFLKYTDEGVPYYSGDMLFPKMEWTLYLYHVLPGLWFGILFFFFYCAVTDYAPPFCIDGGFFAYNRF